ncbi:beta-mannosidase-like isoform X2 [Homalodisca vitripennis]|nr:beta-mannosidase-like isoform X2 [Homalodisca vitripennis]XP_046686491.1 beta-mannosidase-like isoform X2 [Homalodisca vitripennis]XP_046686494.1 beta-mannosidase-like isoform X2 [Homalodisca vitripennis]XP_046686499.1 beta-mannosidase-like isoform X2 [Homalodisca vitripennis]
MRALEVIAVSFYLVVGSTAVPQPLCDSLGTSTWTVQNSNGSIRVGATVPGGIYTDLRTANVLTEDIFYRFNDINYRWVAKDNWTYSTFFDVDPKMLKKDKVYLEFEGLDTVARILLNSQLLGETKNMFILYRFEVKNLLKTSNNSLEVQFTSAIWAAKQLSTETPYPVPPACVPQEYHGECHANYIRKMQASFAWDWGPAFPSVGIWKNVLLRAYNVAHARHVGIETRPDVTDWKVSVTLYLDVATNVTGMLSSTLVLKKYNITTQMTVSISPQQNNATLVFSVPKDTVQMWWPNGYGSQPLYQLVVGFQSDREITQTSVRIGFRTVKLVQVDAVPNQPKKGLTFFFRVNGLAIFAKGSNYIPAHILPELGAEPDLLRRILTGARDANMNMLRVWGGGIYESDLFYQICDELGILIWQDMMFACSMYPATDEFLATVATEVTQQIQRLQHHPSVAIWAGNNENEAALAGNWYGTQANFSIFKADYIKLYVDTIQPIIQKLDKTRSYVTSSPSNGQESEKEGYIAHNPYDGRYGDLHWYEYTLNLWKSAIVPKTRFASEYGIMSLPSLESFSNITLPEDLSLSSELMMSRQHHLGGYMQMIFEIQYNLYLPVNVDLDTFIYLSQINQAMSIKTETESYRRERSSVDSAGEGLTMGALYWQLNDVWQAPSWSSLELSGKWKMLHYFAVDFFAPVLVSPSINVIKQLRVHVISDLQLHSSLNLLLQISVYNWQSLTPVSTQFYPFTLKGAGVVDLGSWNSESYLRSVAGCQAGGHPEKNCFFYFSILSSNASTTLGPNNFLFPVALRSINSPPKANIQVVDVKALKNGQELIVTLGSDAIAPFVWLDAVGIAGHFSHNGFLLVTNSTQLTFSAEKPINVQAFRSSLKIRSLLFPPNANRRK